MRRRASLGALLLTLSRSVAAAGAAPERIALTLPSCELPGVSASELRQAVALDLQPEGLVLAPAGELSPGPDVQVLVEATCAAPDELTLRAERGAQRHERALRLSELALAQRPRALSLALTELVSLVLHPPPPRREEPAPPAPPMPEVATPPPAATTPPAAPAIAPEPDKLASAAATLPSPAPAFTAREDESDLESAPLREISPIWRLGLAPRVRFFDGTSLWGAEAHLARARWRYGAGLLMARQEAAIGTVWTRLLHTSAGYGYPLWGHSGGSVLETGPRLGLGYTWMSAQPTSGAIAFDARDWYLDLAWSARYSAVVSGTFRLGLGAELGYGRGPIGYADDVVIARASGPFASLALDGSLPL